MTLFQSHNPLKAIDTAVANRGRLKVKLVESESAVKWCKAAAQALAIDASADDASLNRAESATRAAQDRVTTITNAIIEVEQQLAGLERERDTAADKRRRAETITEIENLTNALDAIGRDFDSVVTKMQALAETFGSFVPEAQGLLNFTTASKSQIPDAIAMIKMLAGNHAASVLAGTAPPSLRKPDVAVPVVKIASAPTQIMFALRSVKWTNSEGTQQLGAKFSDVYLPTALVSKALKTGAVVSVDDARRKQLKGTQSDHPRLDNATDLDADPDRAPQAKPIMSSSPFTVIYGQPIHGTLKANRS